MEQHQITTPLDAQSMAARNDAWLARIETKNTAPFARHKRDLIELLQRPGHEGGAGMTEQCALDEFRKESHLVMNDFRKTESVAGTSMNPVIFVMHVCAVLYKRTSSKSHLSSQHQHLNTSAWPRTLQCLLGLTIEG